MGRRQQHHQKPQSRGPNTLRKNLGRVPPESTAPHCTRKPVHSRLQPNSNTNHQNPTIPLLKTPLPRPTLHHFHHKTRSTRTMSLAHEPQHHHKTVARKSRQPTITARPPPQHLFPQYWWSNSNPLEFPSIKHQGKHHPPSAPSNSQSTSLRSFNPSFMTPRLLRPRPRTMHQTPNTTLSPSTTKANQHLKTNTVTSAVGKTKHVSPPQKTDSRHATPSASP